MSFSLGKPEIAPVGTGGTGDTFQGRRCLVTGASSGIGMGVAHALLLRGAEVWICSRDPERMEATGRRFTEEFGEKAVHWAVVDVRDEAALGAFADEMAAGGSIDYLFAIAGVGFYGPFEFASDAQFRRVMDVNFYGIIHADHAVIGHMLRQGGGCIANMASLEAYIPNGYHSGYVASKYAVFGFTESLRYEYEDRNIRFATICPGPVKSNIWCKDAEGKLHDVAHELPAGTISELAAGQEILAALEEGRTLILVTDVARNTWHYVRDDLQVADAWCRGFTRSNREIHERVMRERKQTEARSPDKQGDWLAGSRHSSSPEQKGE